MFFMLCKVSVLVKEIREILHVFMLCKVGEPVKEISEILRVFHVM